MRYYSDQLKKVFDTEPELLAAEEAALQELETKKATKAKLAKAVEDATKDLDDAYEALELAEAQVRELQKEYDAKVDALLNPVNERIRDCAKAKAEAIKCFNETYGVYTTSYKGEDALKEFKKIQNQLDRDFFKFSLLGLL